MFADYRIPQCLVWFGALQYDAELMEKLENSHMFQTGDRMEVEIRGCSIHAVELIVDDVRQRILEDPDMQDDTPINAIVVDHFLWDYRREHAQKTQHIPIHKIRCRFY